ncbi:hypothetical protein [Sphingomonas zeae]|nr:hypothetical protein [Sphingomonas zeae]
MSGETPAIKVRRETNAATKAVRATIFPSPLFIMSCAIGVAPPYRFFDDSMLAL